MRPFLRSYLLALLFAASLFLPGIPGRAQIRESSDLLVDMVTEGTLKRLPQLPFAIPTALNSDRDVYLLVRSGAAVWDARLLARLSVPPQRLASILQEALQNLPQHPIVYEWSREEEYSAARCQLSVAHWGQRSSQLFLPIGAMVAGVHQAGWTPHVLIRLPPDAEMSSTSLPRYQTENSVWLCADMASREETLTIRASLSNLDVFLPPFLLGGVLVLGIIGLLAAIGSLRSNSRPLAEKRRLFIRLALWPVYAGLALTTPIGCFYMSSASAARVADLWLGETTRSSTAIFVMPNVAIFLVLSLIVIVLQNKLLPQPNSGPVVTPTEATQIEKALRRRVARVTILVWAVGFGLILLEPYVLPSKSPLSRLWTAGAILMCSLSSSLVRAMFHKKLKAVEAATWDAILSTRLDRIARTLGHRVTGVWITHQEAAQRFIEIRANWHGGMFVSQRSVEVLSAEELDFLMACSLLNSVLWRRSLLGILLLSALGTAPIHMLMFGHLGVPFAWKLPLLLILFPTVMALIAPFARRSVRTREKRILRAALAATGNREAALSALAKQTESGGQLDDAHQRQRILQRQSEQLQQMDGMGF